MSGLIRFIHELLYVVICFFLMSIIKVIVFSMFFASKAVGYPTLPVRATARKVAQEQELSGLQK